MTDSNYPKHVAVDLAPAAKELRALCDRQDIPQLGFDELMSCLFDAVSDKRSANTELHFLPKDVICSRLLVEENPDDLEYIDWNLFDYPADEVVFEEISKKLNQIGRTILRVVVDNRLFDEGGYLRYEYDKTIAGSTVVLRRK